MVRIQGLKESTQGEKPQQDPLLHSHMRQGNTDLNGKRLGRGDVSSGS